MNTQLSTSTFASRLQESMSRKNLTQSDLAEKLNISQVAVSKWTQTTIPKIETVENLADILDVNMSWLLYGRGPKERYVEVRLYNVTAGAGNGVFVDEETSFPFSIPRSLAYKLKGSPNSLEAVYVQGDSMEPIARSGDIAILNRQDKNISDDYYIIRIDGSLLFKRVSKMPGNIVHISSENPKYSPFEINLESPPDDFEIIGRVVSVFKIF